ncbi:heme-binding protein [Candidatus Microgenomates bacterium]|nr:heme-binding protein [Candidatus Microgenomates bacterium]
MRLYEKAQGAINNAVSKASELGIKITVTIVDDHGTTVATRRMEGAISASPRFAHAKAYTSAVIGLPTAGMAQYSTPGKPLYGIESSLGGDLMTIAGGQPIKDGDIVIGAVGVGGSYDVTQDDACAQAAVMAFG